MPILVTETTDEQPRVLLIGEQTALLRQVIHFFQENNLQVFVKNKKELNTKTNQEFEPGFFYKVFFLTSSEEIFENPTEIEKTMQFLENRQRNGGFITLIFSGITPIESNDSELNAWSQLSRAQRVFLENFRSTFPKADVFVGQDVVGLTGSFEPPITSFFTLFQEKKLVDPNIFLTLQTPEDFFEHIKNFLLHPKKNSPVFICGPKKNSGEVVRKIQEFYQDLSGVFLNITQPLVKPLESLTGFHVVSLHQSSVLEKIYAEIQTALLAAKQHQAQQTQSSFSEKKKSKKPSIAEEVTITREFVDLVGHHEPRVVPIYTPVIDNRLKKYEQRKEEINRKRQATKYLNNMPMSVSKKQSSSRTTKKAIQKNVKEQRMEEEIQRVFGQERASQKLERVTRKVEKTIKLEKKNSRRTVLVVFLTLLLGIGVVFGGFTGFFLITRQRATDQLITFAGNFSQPNFSLDDPEQQLEIKSLATSSHLLSSQTNLYQLILGKNNLSEASAVAEVGTEAAETVQTAQRIKGLIEGAFLDFSGKKTENTFQALTNIEGSVEDTYKQISLLQGQLKNADFNSLSQQQTEALTSFSNALQEKRKLLAMGEQVHQLFPTLLAQQGRRTYAVLLQNNEELRPTGGYLQSVALLTIEKGVLIDYQVFDVISLDTQFQGAIQAPVEISTYLGQSRLYLRDANWNPNFPQTAQQVSMFVEKSTGRKPDGVIALNLYSLQDLLRVLGPIEIPEYNETVNDKNLFERAEFHSEVKFVQSAQADYLTTVFNKVLKQMMAAPPEKAVDILSSFYGSLRDGQLFITENEKDQSSLLSSLGWQGEVTTPQCPAQLSDVPCVVDTMMQVEANVGANKANYYLERTIDHHIAISPGKISHERVITFKNTATSDTWPMGSYKSFIRFYVPKTAQIESMTINDQLAPQSFLVMKSDGDKNYFNILIEVPVQKTVKLKLDYFEPLAQTNNFSYAFFEQKQSGTGSDLLRILIEMDPTFHPVVVAPEAQISQSSIQFTTVRDHHQFVGVKFQ